MTYVVDILGQLIMAMVSFWILDRVHLLFELSDITANFALASICICICLTTVLSARSIERCPRTIRERKRAAVKTGPLIHG